MLWICQTCTTAYSVGAEKCPQCGSVEYLEEGADSGAVAAEVVTADEEEDQDA